MPDIIIKTKQGEVIPAIQPEAFGLAVASMEDLDAQMLALKALAEALPKVFQSREDYDKAASIIAQKKALEKLADSTMTPYDVLVKKVKTFIQTQKNIVSNRGEVVYSIVVPAMTEWDEREAKAAKADQDRKQKEFEEKRRREAEEQKAKDDAAAAVRKQTRVADIRADLKAGKITKRQAERLLNEAGAAEEAAKAKAAADEEDAKAKAEQDAAKLKVKPNTGAVAGVVRRTNFTARCTDPKAYIEAVCRAYERKDTETFTRLVAMIEVSDQLLGAESRQVKDNAKMMELYPFVEATSTKSF